MVTAPISELSDKLLQKTYNVKIMLPTFMNYVVAMMCNVIKYSHSSSPHNYIEKPLCITGGEVVQDIPEAVYYTA